MNPMQPLATLLAHAERERDAALGELRRLEIEHRNARDQGEQLQAYRRDYERRWSSEFSRSGGIDIVHCYQGFITRLGQAIEQQTRITQHAAQRLAGAETLWRQRELRVASVRKLLDRRDLEQRSVDNRREQHRIDEQAARLAWSRPPGSRLSSAV